MTTNKRHFKAKLIAGLLLFALVPSGYATNIQDNIGKGSDIVMKELRWPAWDQGTYYCQWYSHFYPGRYSTFYGGVVSKGPDKSPGVFTSYWTPTTEIHVGPNFSGKGYGAEGTKGGATGHLPSLRPGAWFKFVMRVFPREASGEKDALVGYWIKDVERNEWHVHSILKIKWPASGFESNSGFVEALAADQRRVFDRRLGYYRFNGTWKSSFMSTKGPQHVKLIENDNAIRFDTGYREGALAQPFAVKQPATPVLDPLTIKSSNARIWKNQVSVSWTLPKSAPPQIAYKLEAFAEKDARGKPIFVDSAYAPQVNVKRLDVPQAVRSVRLTVTDIFDQTVSTVIPVAPITPPVALKLAGAGELQSGLHYNYYEAQEGETWSELPDFATLKSLRHGRVTGLDVTVQRGGTHSYALRFLGHLRVPKTGLYVVSLKSLDGSRLLLDGTVMGDNDGIHSRSEQMYSVALTAGLHRFELQHFRSKPGIANNQLAVLWEGPGLKRKAMTEQDLLFERSAGAPSIRLTGAKRVLGPEDNLVEIKPVIDARAQKPERVEYYLGEMFLAAVTTPPFVYRSIFPEGENALKARLWCAGGESSDSNTQQLKVKNRLGEWRVENTGEKDLPLGIRCIDDTIAIVGEGSCRVQQPVDGDFTLTARLVRMSLSKETGTNPWNWAGAFTTKPKARVLQTAGYGKRGLHDYPDLCGTGLTIHRYPEGQWIKIVRFGKRTQTFTSVDGATWLKTHEQIGGTTGKEEPFAGITYKVAPRDGNGLFYAKFDKVKLEKGRATAVSVIRPEKGLLNATKRITALVQSGSTLYARSTHQGVLKSTDKGQTWERANGNPKTTEQAMAVRSVAVHPTKSNIVLRGAGRGRGKSGLWRSEDSGASWRLVSKSIDFDGKGPTTLFGEVIAFDAHNPSNVAAGGATTGLFLSKDVGKTWKQMGLKGERISCLAFVHGQLRVGTMADRELADLGLLPEGSAANRPGRIYTLGQMLRRGKRPKGNSKDRAPKLLLEDAYLGPTCFTTAYLTTTRGAYRWEYLRAGPFHQQLQPLPGDALYTTVGNGAGGTCTAPFTGAPPRVYRLSQRHLWTVLADVDTHAEIDRLLTPGSGKEEPVMWKGYVCPKPAADVFLAKGLSGGITCVLPDNEDANTYYVCNGAGISKSTDGGRSYRLVQKSR
jgi:hypothetical protein